MYSLTISNSVSISVSSSPLSDSLVGTYPTTGSSDSKSIKLPDKYDNVASDSLLDNASEFKTLFKLSKSAVVQADNVNTKLNVTNKTNIFFMCFISFYKYIQ